MEGSFSSLLNASSSISAQDSQDHNHISRGEGGGGGTKDILNKFLVLYCAHRNQAEAEVKVGPRARPKTRPFSASSPPRAVPSRVIRRKCRCTA